MSSIVSIADILEREGVFVGTTSGISMYPMLRDRRDTVVIKPYTAPLKKYDVALYKQDGKYVLHRIVRVLPDSYITCGDNFRSKECEIKHQDILGVLKEFYRDDKKVNMEGISYRLYARLAKIISFVCRLIIRFRR